ELARSRIVLELIEPHGWLLLALGLVLDHPHEVSDLVDHAADCRGVLERAPAAQLVQSEPDQGLLLDGRSAVRAGDLLDSYRLAAGRGLPGPALGCLSLCHDTHPVAVSAASASAAAASRRRATISLGFLPRRLATARGFSCAFSASKVARTML